MSRLVRAVFALAIVVPLGAQSPPPTAPQPTFHGGTDLVQVDVSVLDGHRGDSRADRAGLHGFRGRPAARDSSVHRGLSSRPSTTARRRVDARRAERRRTNQTAREEGRLVVIVLDRTIPVGQPEVTARRIAIAAVNQLGPGDLAAVVSTNNGAAQNLTSDHAKLLRAINASDLASDISDDAREIEASVFALTGRTWSELNDGRCQCGLCVLDTITTSASRSRRSRRAIICSRWKRPWVHGSPDARCGSW